MFNYLFFQGENAQLHMELSRMAKVKDNLSSELARLSNEAEKLEILSTKHEDLEKRYTEIQSDYQTMLTVSFFSNIQVIELIFNWNSQFQMYGEKEEETQELRLDLQDVKEMYKIQIEELLRKQQNSDL